MANETRKIYITVIILFLGQLTLTGASQSLAAVAPLIEADLGLTKAQFGVFTSFFYIGAVSASLPSGSIVDTLGGRIILFSGLMLSGVGITMFSLFSNYLLLLILFLLAGLGYSTITPVSAKAIVELVPLKYRGTAMGFKQTGVTVGGALAAATLPFVAMLYNWRTAVLLCGIMLVVMGIMTWFIYWERERVNTARNDKTVNYKWIKDWLSVIRHRHVLVMSVMGFIMASSQLAIITYFVMFFSEHLAFDLIQSGRLLSITLLGATLGRLSWGFISDQLFNGNRKIVLAFISLLASLGLMVLSLLHPGVSYFFVAVLAAIIGATAIGWNALFLIAIGEMTAHENVGTATGFATMFVFLGPIIGAPLFGFLVDLNEGFTFAFRIFSLTLFVVALIFLFIYYQSREKNTSFHRAQQDM